MGGIDGKAAELSELIDIIGLNESLELPLLLDCFGPTKKDGLYTLNYARGDEMDMELAVSNNLPLLGGPEGKGGLPGLG